MREPAGGYSGATAFEAFAAPIFLVFLDHPELEAAVESRASKSARPFDKLRAGSGALVLSPSIQRWHLPFGFSLVPADRGRTCCKVAAKVGIPGADERLDGATAVRELSRHFIIEGRPR